jgi:DNA-binding transcriptional LysR family regulator
MTDTHRLHVFLVAAETLNFSEAARQLHMTQPSVSQHIQALEQQFDQALFYRYGRYVELTEGGQRLVTLARDMMERWTRLEEEMETLKGEVTGHLLVGCSTTPGKYILPQLLARFHRSYPKVSVTCHVSSQERSLEMLCNGEVHFALASAPHVCHSDVEFRRFTVDPVQLIAPLNHPWAARAEIEPEDLYGADFIMREEGSGTRAAVSEALATVGIRENDLHTFLTLGNSEAIALAVQEELGVAYVSQFVVTRLVPGQVATIRVRGLDIEREIYFGRHTR